MNARRLAISMNRQTGAMLLEGLIALLIFSAGFLGVMAVQAEAIRHTAEARYRTDALLLADKVIARIWVHTLANRQTDFKDTATLGAQYTTWRTEVIATLPGVSATLNAPTIAFNGVNPNQVTVTVRWQAPGATVHQYLTTAEVSQQ